MTSTEQVVEEMKKLVSADGADLDLLSPPDSAVMELRLVLDDVSCPECVLPPGLLVEMISDHVRRALPSHPEVRLIDPRVP